MRKRILVIVIVIISAGLYFTSCSSRRIKKDMTDVSNLNNQLAEGRIIFKNKCQKCHPNGEAGVGPALNDKKLPSFIIRARIRSRATFLWTGRMPAFSKHEISKDGLDALLVYLKDMEKKDKK